MSRERLVRSKLCSMTQAVVCHRVCATAGVDFITLSLGRVFRSTICFKQVLKRLRPRRHHGTPKMAHLQVPGIWLLWGTHETTPAPPQISVKTCCAFLCDHVLRHETALIEHMSGGGDRCVFRGHHCTAQDLLCVTTDSGRQWDLAMVRPGSLPRSFTSLPDPWSRSHLTGVKLKSSRIGRSATVTNRIEQIQLQIGMNRFITNRLPNESNRTGSFTNNGNPHPIHHHLLETISETTTVLASRRSFRTSPPSSGV